jgi:hypothetical protein
MQTIVIAGRYMYKRFFLQIFLSFCFSSYCSCAHGDGTGTGKELCDSYCRYPGEKGSYLGIMKKGKGRRFRFCALFMLCAVLRMQAKK